MLNGSGETAAGRLVRAAAALPNRLDFLRQPYGRRTTGLILISVAVTLAVSTVQAAMDHRLLAVVVVLISVLLAAGDSDVGVRLAVLVIPFLGFMRRVTAGPDAYVFNDPLALLSLALLVPVLLAVPRTRPGSPARWMLYLAGWLLVTGALGILRGVDTQTMAYGTAGSILPLLAGLYVANGHYRGLARFSLVALPVTAVLASLYGVVQWLVPPSWDLAWLTTQGDLLVSVGPAEARQFRIFGTAESPGALSLLLGLAALVLACDVLVRRRPAGTRTAQVGAIALIVFVLALASVRTALLALPIALLTVLLVDRRVPRSIVAPVVGVLVAAVLWVPSVLAASDAGRARYELGQLQQDPSLQERSQLLPAFGEAVASSPLGQGPGTTGLGARLADLGANAAVVHNVDNGYLTRLIETGVPGLALYLTTVVVCIVPAWRRVRNGRARPTDVPCLGIVVFFILADLAGPNTTSVSGLVFWIALGALGAGSHFPQQGRVRTAA